ncbi:hypothetical protein MMC31_000857 [Peltigera leucophlebia]|nr:hypothetical protein [Peltigera leucophlebia]
MNTFKLAALQERLVILTGEENYDAWYETVCSYAMANRVRKHLDPPSVPQLSKAQARPPNHANTSLLLEEQQQQEAAGHEQHKKLGRDKDDEQVAAGIIMLSIDQSLRKVIKSSKTPWQMMERLKERFGSRKEGVYSARYKAWLTIHPTATTGQQSDNKSTISLAEWGELVSKGKAAMVGMGETLPEWTYICAFMRGLSGGEFAAYVDDLLHMLDQRAEEFNKDENNSNNNKKNNDDSDISFEEVLESFLQHEREVKKAKAEHDEQRDKKTEEKKKKRMEPQPPPSPKWSVRISFFDDDDGRRRREVV